LSVGAFLEDLADLVAVAGSAVEAERMSSSMLPRFRSEWNMDIS